MPKRKRDDDDAQNSGNSSIVAKRIEHKLKVGATKLGHAFKIAKGFERQKLGRRQKNAVSQSNSKDVARINSEIEALKVGLFLMYLSLAVAHKSCLDAGHISSSTATLIQDSVENQISL